MDCPWNSLGQNTGVRSLSLLQGIFPTEGSNPCLSHWRQILYHLRHQGSPTGDRNGCPLQYSGLENSMDSPWGCKESDMTEWLSLSLHSSPGPILSLFALEPLSTHTHSSSPWLCSLVLSHACPSLACHLLPFYSNPPSFPSPNLMPLSATTQLLDSVTYSGS